ncbi:MAG: CDP-diacylglycerol--serine O-phosphatidyltransferase [Acidiferrobacterales bacterium]|nr:CDP-diacylglycerol--serine O-phosphatidyltransferase [Acidiferrobacterales bacterium]
MSENDPTSNARKGIYFLPSLFTTAGLFFGFFAIIQATHGNFDRAALAIFVAMIMDGLDGRVARWTNTASDFGKEYDSLVDLIAFGLAPALVVYFWSLQSIGRAGWLIAFLYAAATALRLARFNTLTIKDNRYFFGLPSPSAGAFVVFWVWCMHDFEFTGYDTVIAWLSALVTVSAAILMVSNVKFRSFKDFDYKNKIPFVVLIVLILAYVLISSDPPTVLFLITLGYVLSGLVSWVWRWRKGDESSPSFLPDDHEDEEHFENESRKD